MPNDRLGGCWFGAESELWILDSWRGPPREKLAAFASSKTSICVQRNRCQMCGLGGLFFWLRKSGLEFQFSAHWAFQCWEFASKIYVRGYWYVRWTVLRECLNLFQGLTLGGIAPLSFDVAGVQGTKAAFVNWCILKYGLIRKKNFFCA